MKRLLARFTLWLASWVLSWCAPQTRRHWPLRVLRREISLELDEGLRDAFGSYKRMMTEVDDELSRGGAKNAAKLPH